MLVQRYLRVAEADHAEIAGGEIRAGPPPGVPGLVLPRGKQYAKGAGHLRIIELSVMRIMRVTNRTLWPLAVGELAPGDYYSAAERRLLASHTNPSASSRRRRSGSDRLP